MPWGLVYVEYGAPEVGLRLQARRLGNKSDERFGDFVQSANSVTRA